MTLLKNALVRCVVCSLTAAVLMSAIGLGWFYLPFGYKYPAFIPNGWMYDMNSKYLDYARQYDYVIGYRSSSSDRSYPYKILAGKNEEWVLITRDDEWFLSAMARPKVENIKNLDKVTAELILDSLAYYGLFALPAEEILIKKCESISGSNMNLSLHGRMVEFEIIKGLKMRRRHYSSWKKCDEVEDWRRIGKLISLFDRL